MTVKNGGCLLRRLCPKATTTKTTIKDKQLKFQLSHSFSIDAGAHVLFVLLVVEEQLLPRRSDRRAEVVCAVAGGKARRHRLPRRRLARRRVCSMLRCCCLDI